jgi:hypothetical protein
MWCKKKVLIPTKLFGKHVKFPPFSLTKNDTFAEKKLEYPSIHSPQNWTG